MLGEGPRVLWSSLLPEQSCMLHVCCISVVGLLATEADPEEVVWLLTLVQDLHGEPLHVVHRSNDILSDLGFVRI